MTIHIRNLIQEDIVQKQKSLTASSQMYLTKNTEPTAQGMLRAKKVFAEFGLIYGHLWKSVHAGKMLEEATKRWALELEKLTEDEIERAINESGKYEHPPSLPKFREYARGPFADKLRVNHGAYSFFKPDPQRRADKPSPLLEEYMRQNAK